VNRSRQEVRKPLTEAVDAPGRNRTALLIDSFSGRGRHGGRRPGCYGYQLDGLTFSRVIVFRVAR
jgi:hypothetical protein